MIQTLQTVNEYKEELVYPAICRSFEALDIAKDMRSDLHVVIKPNLIMAKSPDFPATTHPVVVKCVARWLHEHGVTDITIAESSGGPYNAEHMKKVYRVCGMDTASEYAKLNDDFTSQTVECPNGFANHTFHLLTPIVKADYIISVCKLKTHAMTGYSGGIKNMFGTIPGLEKPQLHYRFPNIKDFSNMLLELAQTVNPNVTVIDAIDAMEGNGPTGGNLHKLNMLLCARDFYTQDYFAAGLMGIEPQEIEMIKQAMDKGLIHPDEIKLVGDRVPENLTPFAKPDALGLDFSGKLPKFLDKPFTHIAARLLKSYPELENEKCVGCGKCAESCPAHVIKIENRKAKFAHKGCISCFCCQEMCPMKAINVHKSIGAFFADKVR